MKKNWLIWLVRILAFTITIYVLQRYVLNNTIPQEIVSPIPEVTPTATPTPTQTPATKAKASWYGGYFHGRRTASGEVFDEMANTMACANRFSLGTVFRLSYKGKTEIARCTDRGGFEALGRTFDLSKGLFEKLAPLSAGVISVDYEIVNNYDQP